MSDKETLGEGRRQIGMKLRAAREEAEIDLADLSVRTGFSEEEIEAIENGEQMIYQTDLVVLCAALNVSPKDIVGRPQTDSHSGRQVGYRAHFRTHYECGLKFNDQLIHVLRGILDMNLQDTVMGRELDDGFEDIGRSCARNSGLPPFLSH